MKLILKLGDQSHTFDGLESFTPGERKDGHAMCEHMREDCDPCSEKHVRDWLAEYVTVWAHFDGGDRVMLPTSCISDVQL